MAAEEEISQLKAEIAGALARLEVLEQFPDSAEPQVSGAVGDYENWLHDQVISLRADIGEIYRRLAMLTSDDATAGTEQCRTESPEVVGTSGEGDESPDTGSWPTANGDPLILHMMSRGGYFDASAQTFYGYSRALGYDGCGKLLYVTAEARYPIFTTEDCTDAPAFGF